MSKHKGHFVAGPQSNKGENNYDFADKIAAKYDEVSERGGEVVFQGLFGESGLVVIERLPEEKPDQPLGIEE